MRLLLNNLIPLLLLALVACVPTVQQDSGQTGQEFSRQELSRLGQDKLQDGSLLGSSFSFEPQKSSSNNNDALQTTRPNNMALITAKCFQMGCNDGEFGCEADEQPKHQVCLDSYYIDIFEVTVNEYKTCVLAGKCREPDRAGFCNYSKPGRELHPVSCAAWEDAQRYCAWLGKRLPTEAEWEFAARGTTDNIYPWGATSPSCDLAVTDNGCGNWSTMRPGRIPAGVSPFGLHNMAGNVREWVADWYAADYYSSSPENNPTGPRDGAYRVLRGGSWNSDQAHLKTYSRNSGDFTKWRSSGVGFRCAKTTSPRSTGNATENRR